MVVVVLKFITERMYKTDHSQHLGLNERILKWILEEQGV
jgi:hypothetical protein